MLRIDLDRSGNILKGVMNERQPSFLLLDRRLALPLEAGIDKRELPTRRWHDRVNSVLAAVKMQIFSFVARVFDSRETGANPEVHMRQQRVLRIMGTNTN